MSNNAFDVLDIEKRVKRGYEYMNRVKPFWQREIEQDTLDLADGESCIIGQVFGDFTEYFNYYEEEVSQEEAAMYGFDVIKVARENEDKFPMHQEYSLLAEEWIRSINSDNSWKVVSNV